MAAKWISSSDDTPKAETTTIYEGLSFDHFAYESHSRRDYGAFVKGYLFPLSEQMNVYAAEQESAIRVKDGKLDILGPVYLISESNIQKLIETL
ncbi:hypothetical protein D3C75_1159400 [compost metagenome]